MQLLHVTLLGKLKICTSDGRECILGSQKAQELFSYLLFFRDIPHQRDQLAGQFWPERDDKQAKKSLRQTLWQIQTAIGDPDPAPAWFLTEAQWIQLNPDSHVDCDCAAFERAYHACAGIPGHQLDPDQVSKLQQAVSLYRADLLQGWYMEWCIFERERLQNIYLALLEKLMNHCEASQNYQDGVDYGLLALRVDRARERCHRRLMRLRYLAGDRTGALRQYQYCRQALAEELDVTPAASTEKIRHLIEIDDRETLLRWPLAPTYEPPAGANLNGILRRLQKLQDHLASLQAGVADEIQGLQQQIRRSGK